ncbi:type II toxin-antitoxin system RelE/ParE family toxin [Egbenema bharatensis]|uniref:type II toxin-antitoxin system RelE/ParE family toxin n=1 Tax=Egbenema bharatensis TaxID=3463334 RepID=UPI003A895744
MPRVKRTAKAKQDLLKHVLYLAQINPDIAERFIEASEMAFEKLAQMPRKGQRQEFKSPKLVEVRRWFIPGFDKYLIFYRPITGGIEILRVLHGVQNVNTIMDDEGS